jgi:hypothetical protein
VNVHALIAHLERMDPDAQVYVQDPSTDDAIPVVDVTDVGGKAVVIETGGSE